MATRKIHIVWNEGLSEGVVFTDSQDAHEAQSGKMGNPCSTLGDAFVEIYEEDRRILQTVEVPVITPKA